MSDLLTRLRRIDNHLIDAQDRLEPSGPSPALDDLYTARRALTALLDDLLNNTP